MDDGKISVRYARALMHQADEERCAEAVYDGLVRLTDNYSLAIQSFNEVLSNPMVSDTEKLRLLHLAIGEPLHPCLTRFLDFVTEKKRENKIFLIALKYQEMYRKANRIVRADVTTAVAPDERSLDRLRAFVEQTFQCTAELRVKTDPTLIGGFTLDIEHERMDASVAGRLNALKKQLKTEN